MDIPTILGGDYNPEHFERLNRELQDGLNSGVYNQEYTTAQIAQLTSSATLPVLRAGTVFFNSDLRKLQVIVVAADPETSTDSVIETITSA